MTLVLSSFIICHIFSRFQKENFLFLIIESLMNYSLLSVNERSNSKRFAETLKRSERSYFLFIDFFFLRYK